MRRSIFVIFVMLGFLYPSVIIAEEVRLSLDEAIAIALRDNRDILLKAEELKKAKTKIAEAKASLLPTLNFIGSWTDTRGSYSKDIAQTSTQTTLKQVLYKGGRIINTIKFNEYEVSIAESILDKAKLDVLLNVKKAFYTLLLTREFVDLNKSMMDNMLEHLQSMKERYKSGQASESDVLSIESSLSNVGQAYESSLNQVESAQGLLNNVLYLEKSVKITPEANLDYDKREVAFDEAFLKAMRNRPEIKQYEAQRQANLKTIEIAKSDTRPNIYASWDYYSRSHTIGTTGSLSKNSNDNNIIGLVFSWPIFDGWAAKAKVEQAIVDLKETQLLKEKTINDIALELKNAYLSLKNAIARIDSTESDLKVYKDNFIIVKEKYDQGITSTLDINDANLKFNVSMFNKKQAIYDYIVANSNFDKATGGL